MIFDVRLKLAAVCAAVVLALGGCAHPQMIDMGQTQAEVIAKLGEPNAKTVLPDGRTRLTYSSQPFGQEVWWLFLDENGRTIERQKALKPKNFDAIKVGVWTEDDVWKYWGKYAQAYTFHLVNEHAWMYRFKDDAQCDMAVWVQFSAAGIVTEVAVTQDPWNRFELRGFAL